jgi:hypothetical protein
LFRPPEWSLVVIFCHLVGRNIHFVGVFNFTSKVEYKKRSGLDLGAIDAIF